MRVSTAVYIELVLPCNIAKSTLVLILLSPILLEAVNLHCRIQ